MRLVAGRRLLVYAALLGLAFAASLVLPLRAWAIALAEATRGLGPVGPLAFLAAYVAAALLALPASPLSLAAGLAFGPVGGALLAAPALALSASVAFLVGRRVARRAGPGAPAPPAIAAAAHLAEREGVRLILLLRLSPLTPFSALNFAFGATRMRLGEFALGSLLGSIPSATAYAFLGAMVSAERSADARWFGLGAVVLTVVAALGCARLASGAAARERGAARDAPDA